MVRLPSIAMSWRISPLFDGAAFTVNAAQKENGMTLWCVDREGITAMEATVEFEG